MQQNIDKMKDQIEKPYLSFLQKDKELRTVHVVELCLKKVLRFSQIMQKLNKVLKKKDLSKAALWLKEISILLNDTDQESKNIFKTLKLVRNKIPEYETHRSYVISTAKTQLNESMKELDTLKMGSALQVLFNFGGESLITSIEEIIQSILKEINRDILKIHISQNSGKLSSGSVKNTFWKRVENLFNNTY
eukprot:UN27431